MLRTYFTVYITSPLSFCRIRFIRYFGSIKKFQVSPSRPSGLFVSVRLNTQQSALQNTEHQSQLHPHQHRSLHFITKNEDTGDWPVSDAVSLALLTIPTAVGVSRIFTGNFQVQFLDTTANCFRYVICRGRILHTASAASLTVTAWTQSQSCNTDNQQAIHRAEGSGDVISDYRWLTICFIQFRDERFIKYWWFDEGSYWSGDLMRAVTGPVIWWGQLLVRWFDEGSYWSKPWFMYRDRIITGRFLQVVKNVLIS